MRRLVISTTAMIATASLLALSAGVAQTGNSTRDGQKYGWTVQAPPVNAEDLERPLNELERLSQSSTGAGFIDAIYNVVSDNPLLPVTVTLRALDKITAQYTDLTIDIGKVQDFGKLRILPRTCNKRPPEEVPETSAFLEIIDLDALARLEKAEAEALAEQLALEAADVEAGASVDGEAAPVAVEEIVEETSSDVSETENATGIETPEEFTKVPAIFRGWMFASSPALNPVDHPVYDVWVIDCKMVEPSQ
jgi:hypothetical protein